MPKGGKPNIVTKSDTLAVAYTDSNGNDKFDKKDVLIAAVVDGNHDNQVSVGDTVVFGKYPLNVDGTAFGKLQHDASPVVGVNFYIPNEFLNVSTDDGQVLFQHTNADFDVFATSNNAGSEVELIDGFATQNDLVFASTDVNGPALPDTNVLRTFVTQAGDQPFLDVFIT
jgi:hypothetical protein